MTRPRKVLIVDSLNSFASGFSRCWIWYVSFSMASFYTESCLSCTYKRHILTYDVENIIHHDCPSPPSGQKHTGTGRPMLFLAVKFGDSVDGPGSSRRFTIRFFTAQHVHRRVVSGYGGARPVMVYKTRYNLKCIQFFFPIGFS